LRLRSRGSRWSSLPTERGLNVPPRGGPSCRLPLGRRSPRSSMPAASGPRATSALRTPGASVKARCREATQRLQRLQDPPRVSEHAPASRVKHEAGVGNRLASLARPDADARRSSSRRCKALGRRRNVDDIRRKGSSDMRPTVCTRCTRLSGGFRSVSRRLRSARGPPDGRSQRLPPYRRFFVEPGFGAGRRVAVSTLIGSCRCRSDPRFRSGLSRANTRRCSRAGRSLSRRGSCSQPSFWLSSLGRAPRSTRSTIGRSG